MAAFGDVDEMIARLEKGQRLEEDEVRGLCEKARESGLGLDKAKLNGLRFWYEKHVLEEDERRRLESEVTSPLSERCSSTWSCASSRCSRPT